jgi:ferric-dicitrate binding protein FerR (iron transport regulator)
VTIGFKVGLSVLAMSLLGMAVFWRAETSDSTALGKGEFDAPIRISNDESEPLKETKEERPLWREREKPSSVEFNEVPLKEIVEEFNRTGLIQIELADRKLEALEVTGRLDPKNPEAFLQLLELIFQIRVERMGENRIALKPPSN